MYLSKQQASGEPTEQYHRNSGLFSDHYLNVSLPRRIDWQELVSEAGDTLQEISKIFAAYTPSKNESQTETGLIQPVLQALGHDFEVQASLQTPEGTKKPDYVFYKDAEALNTNKNRTLDEESLYGKSFAVGDAKYWDRPLDVALKGKQKDSLTNNPSYQIYFYMLHAGADWGILTNGRLWRLYHRDTAHKLDRFYEVDLQELVENEDVERFLYFYAFFRRVAFDDGPLGVSSILQASEDYARGVGDSLKGQVYQALRHIAQGFLDNPANGLDVEAEPEKLQEIYDNSLILLYRLLFVLYAEARELLPVRGSDLYRKSYSLHAIKHDVADGSRLLPSSATIWPRLAQLFQSIDKGNPPLSVATFNGGLFDPARHPFLERYAVGDAHLQGSIDRISRVKGEFVDYRDLSERHLGTIYEGLLEFHLRPLEEAEDGWTVDLLNDNDERKATGSYYTPDFVVKYIVEQTVGPMLQAAVEGAPSDAAKVEAVLALDVLDPAMGSGHAPIFPDADVFPCIVVLQKRGSATKDSESDGEVRVAAVPREELGGMDLDRTVEAHAHTVPRERFGKDAWSLESSAVDDLMAKIRRNGVPLAEFAGVKPAYGIKTGLNEAFLIDTATKDRLVREDPSSAEVIKPYLRGQDIKRWSPDWQDLWMIVLKSSGDHAWPWSDAGDNAEEVFRQTYPALHAHMKSFEEKLRKRQDHGRYWWELRACAYYEIFEQPKIIHTDITWRP